MLVAGKVDVVCLWFHSDTNEVQLQELIIQASQIFKSLMSADVWMKSES